MGSSKLWSVVATLCLVATVAFAGPAIAAGKLTLTGKLRWVVVATSPDRNIAVGTARLYEPRNIRVVRLRQGGYSAVLGPVSASSVDAFRVLYKKGWIGEGKPFVSYVAKWLELPADAVLTRGEDYLDASWTPSGNGLTIAAIDRSGTVRSGSFSVDLAAKGGRTSFHISVDKKPGITLTFDTPVGSGDQIGTHLVQLAWLDRSAAHPQIVLNQYSTGKPTLLHVWIVTEAPDGWRLIDGGRPSLSLYYLEDIDGDGNDEMFTTDPSLPQFFDSSGELEAPPVIKRLSGAHLIDVTTEPSSRDRILQRIREIETPARQLPSFWRDNGFLAGWVATKTRAGAFDDAWSRMLTLFDPRAEPAPTVCADGSDVLKCPPGQVRAASFPEALASRLRVAGYDIPANLAYSDPAASAPQPNATLTPDQGSTIPPQAGPPAAQPEPTPAAVTQPEPPPAATAKSDKPAPPVKEAQIYSGSGFFVAKGRLVSNAHVVKGCEDVTVRLGSVEGMGHVVARDLANDLALIETAVPTGPLASLRTAPRLGEVVSAFGFPLSDILATTGNFTRGNVTATAGMGDDSRFLQISAPVQPGNSGGPLLDESGNVVGVVNAKIDALVMAKLTKDIPQNINFAIKSSVLENFLEARGVRYNTGKLADKLDPSDIADRAQSFTAVIFCRL